jgi:pyridoxamine 5'-phosphate oxidase
MNNIADIRTDYKLQSFSESDALPDPILQFSKWWNEALQSNIDEVNAMTLATSSIDGMPAARIVLLKGFDEKGFVFFTNYDSSKGHQLYSNPRACLVFFWKELERQVRITGNTEKTSGPESDTYFNSRPKGSRLGAWASPQSEIIASREWLEEKSDAVKQQFEGKEIGRPPYWGGYRVVPATVEFWQGRPNRLHDRIQYSLQENASWKIERLAP